MLDVTKKESLGCFQTDHGTPTEDFVPPVYVTGLYLGLNTQTPWYIFHLLPSFLPPHFLPSMFHAQKTISDPPITWPTIMKCVSNVSCKGVIFAGIYIA